MGTAHCPTLRHVALRRPALSLCRVAQHREERIELRDKTKEGSRTTITLFLVDPSLDAAQTHSTATVPPQRLSWWAREAGLLARLPAEVMPWIAAHLDWPLTRNTAEEHRRSLLRERAAVLSEHDIEFYSARLLLEY